MHQRINFLGFLLLSFAISLKNNCFHMLQTIRLNNENRKTSKNKVWQNRHLKLPLDQKDMLVLSPPIFRRLSTHDKITKQRLNEELTM